MYCNMKVLLVCLIATLARAQEMDDGSAAAAERMMELNEIQANYVSDSAASVRESHFFCLDRTTTFDSGVPSVTFTEFEQNGSYVWTLFVQMPLISYLDPARKQSLMDVVLDVLNNGQLLDEICIGTYETYELSYFRESILIHVYSKTSDQINPQTWTDRLNTRITTLMRQNSDLVVNYPGQSGVIAFNLSASMYFSDLLLPRLQTNDGTDITALAVFIGSYGFNYTFVEKEADSISRNIDGQSMRSFAANTDPINYGLEAGDIVFAVFGSILLIILGGLIVLGYFIHPFFLA